MSAKSGHLVASLVEKLQVIEAAHINDEAAFHSAWINAVDSECTPFELAILGGAQADRFGFIFSAGYQAAIRHVFREEAIANWAAFAVSEDRSATNPLPGLRYDSEDKLTGWKTWVAASNV